jgi:hypothetical protein
MGLPQVVQLQLAMIVGLQEMLFFYLGLQLVLVAQLVREVELTRYVVQS